MQGARTGQWHVAHKPDVRRDQAVESSSDPQRTSGGKCGPMMWNFQIAIDSRHGIIMLPVGGQTTGERRAWPGY